MALNAEFADNPEARCPCLLLLDASGSMEGQPIDELNSGLVAFAQELSNDNLASKRVDVAVVTFGDGVKVEAPFTSAGLFFPPHLVADSLTPMGEAIVRGLEMLRTRKEEYRNNGITIYRPWVFLITDGAPTDDMAQARQLIHTGERERAFSFYAVGVEGADMDMLNDLSPPGRTAMKLKGLDFKALFLWLSSSLRAVSSCAPTDPVPLQNPTEGPSGWATTNY